jgi:predicted 2-oxoglutarate/Fe(II)-dependent dioxygenase YbiX
MIKTVLHPEIHYYKNVISKPNEIVSEIEMWDGLQSPMGQISNWKEWKSSKGETDYGFVKTCLLNQFQNFSVADRSNIKISSLISNIAITIAEEYAQSAGIELGYFPVSFGINKYNNNVFMGPHVDAYDGAQDKSTVSMVIYLNDDYEGGEIDFPDHGISLKPEAGSVVVFASEGILHDPRPTKSGTKYMVPIFFFKR